MAMDGLSLAASVIEARSLIGGRIDKIQQPDNDEMVMLIRSGGENRRLLISASPENCRLQITGVKRENPIEAPAFCMLMRKRLVGGRIVSIEQPDLDRVVNITIEAQNELGDIAPYILCAEIMGKYSNIILINDRGIIADAIKRVSLGMSNVRTVLPGQKYVAPPSQDKRNPLEVPETGFYDALTGSARVDKALSAAFFGLAPWAAELLCGERRSADSLEDHERATIAERLYGFYQKLRAGEFTPVIILDCDGNPNRVLPFVPDGMKYRKMPSLGEALDQFYAENDLIQRMRRRGAGIRRVLQNHIERCNKKLSLYEDAIDSQEDGEKLRLYGELLTANAYALPQNASEAVVVNYYADPPEKMIIPLDPRFSPNVNAQKYYKKYQKAKSARDMAVQQRKKTLEELEYLEGQMDNLDKCTGDAELGELWEEMAAEGYIKHTSQIKKTQKLSASRPMSFISSDGIEILVGKNNRQNDQLTLKTAAPTDIWLHTKDIPGSHVIVRGTNPPESTIYEAALLAAYYSRGRNSSNVAVDFTEKKYVKKPAGAKPGMVVYTTNRTAYVTPDPDEIKKVIQKQ